MKNTQSFSLALRGRQILAAGRQLGRAVLGYPTETAIARPAISDFTPLLWGGRRMTPDQVRQVIEQAVGGNLQQQWALFDMMEDSWPRLVKNLNELKRAAARTTYTVKAYAERGEKPSDDATDRARTVEASLANWRPRPGTLELSFEDALYNALDAYGKGISVLETTWQKNGAGMMPRCAHVLHISRYGWNPAGNELGLINAGELGSRTWSPFLPGQFMVGIWHSRTGAPGQTALLRCLAPYWCGITFGWEWLLNNAQIFGVPLRWATYDANRADLLPTLTEMLANLGNAGWAAFPEGTTMEFKEAVSRASDNPQVVVQAAADKACDLLILGQEASGESKPAGIGSGASDLHGAVRADRLQDAAQWCADLLNYQLVPAVLRWNYGDEAEMPEVVPDLASEPDPKAKAERDVQLAQLVAMPRKWFFQRHAIPEPEEGEEVVGGPGALPDLNFPPNGADTSGSLAAPGGENSPETADPAKSRQNNDPAQGGTKTPTKALSARLAHSPRPAVARGAIPGAYRMPADQLRQLQAAHSRDFAALRKASQPLFAAIEAGDLAVIGELEAFIARLDELAPTMIGASELADALEAGLAEASIAGAAQAYGKISATKPTP